MGDFAKLHAFARNLGLKREWFQDHRELPHYDLVRTRREAALALGATAASRNDRQRPKTVSHPVRSASIYLSSCASFRTACGEFRNACLFRLGGFFCCRNRLAIPQSLKIMSLLREIQDAAVDGSYDLETLLRKCRVLATRLKHEELKKWVACELDGYPIDMPLPEYRKCLGQPFGHFFGDFGRGLKNCPIPISDIPEDVRDAMAHKLFREGVGELQNLVNTVEGTTLQFGWPAEAGRFVRPKNMAHDLVLAQGWLIVSKSRVVGILSTV